jgi:adenylate cyclase
MAESRQSGKLAVILHADIAGSTTLVQQDEHLAHDRIQDTFGRFKETIDKYHGRVRELRGDALLADFERASDAASAALVFQAEQLEYIATLDDIIRPTIRVGIAMGEVIIADNTVTGAGVVLAQRIEQLAEPGGVCITSAIHEALPKRMPFDLESLGERELKGFDEQVRVYAVNQSPGATIPAPQSPLKIESEALNLPNKPSIAVLPFTNMSGDSDQDYFSDGITEDIITELARFRNLFVIARHSSFAFKGQRHDLQTIGKNLGVQYIVEGSVRRAGERVRISVQLVEAATGNQIWAERYDRLIDDIFAVQDEVTLTIIAALPGRLESDYAERAKRKPVTSMTAYDYLLRGHMHCHRLTRDEITEARKMYFKAIELDPDLAQAHAWLAWTFHMDHYFVWETQDSTDLAKESINRALALDDNDGFIRTVYAYTLRRDGRADEAAMQFEKAVELNPNDPIAIAWLAEFLVARGRSVEALQWIEKAIRRDPFHVDLYCVIKSEALYCLRDYSGAIRAIIQAKPSDNYWSNALLAASCAQIDRMVEAKTAAQRVLSYRDESRKSGRPLPFSELEFDFMDGSDYEHFRDGLHKAGLLE